MHEKLFEAELTYDLSFKFISLKIFVIIVIYDAENSLISSDIMAPIMRHTVMYICVCSLFNINTGNH